MKRRRWGQRKLSDEAIRQIRLLAQDMPRCGKTDRELAAQFHVGHRLVNRIVLGWTTPRGDAPPMDFNVQSRE